MPLTVNRFSEGFDRTKCGLGYFRECSNSLITEDSGGRYVIFYL